MKKVVAVLLFAGILFTQVGASVPTVNVAASGDVTLPFEH